MATARRRTTRAGVDVPVRRVEGGRIARRVLGAAAAIAVIAFAVQGGEYGTTDLLRQRKQIAAERAKADSLEASIAQLQAELKAIETDPAMQERIAREEFGMVKEGELLYRFTDPETPPR